MSLAETLREADRQLTVCNACRYCEGYCAVFPAMERRRTFSPEDVIYLANLCFECRACYYACQFAPPHQYAINIPQALSAVRVQTYNEFATPRLLSRLFGGNGFRVGLAVALCCALVFAGALLVQGGDVVFGTPAAAGSFYEVIPYLAIVLPAMALSLFWLGALAYGGLRFWRSTGGRLTALFDASSFWRATRDAFGLEYLRNGGEGCNYPTARFSQSRRFYHQALVAGVLLDLASTTVAAVYHNFLGRDAPYPYLSPPVLLGTVGGVLILIGGIGLLVLKARADRGPAHPPMLAYDQAFLCLLLATSVSGLLLLAMRETAAMGTLLAIHLGIVAALFLTLPYGKFAHVVYRYAALIRYRIEARDEG